MKIHYQEESLSKVLQYWQKDYENNAGEKVKNFGQPFVDVSQGKVLFQLYLENDEDASTNLRQP